MAMSTWRCAGGRVRRRKIQEESQRSRPLNMAASVQRMLLKPRGELLSGALGKHPGTIGIQMPVVLAVVGVRQGVDFGLQRVKIWVALAHPFHELLIHRGALAFR